MSMTPYSDIFVEAKVNNFYQAPSAERSQNLFANFTVMLEENNETLNPAMKVDIQHHLLGVIHRRSNNIGNSALYVESTQGSISKLEDINECYSHDFNDCHPNAVCSNIWGGFRCECVQGLKDPFADDPVRAGKDCIACSEAHCNNRGNCSFDDHGNQVCACIGNFYGSTCDLDGEVLGVAISASVMAVIIIILTLVCLIMWR